MRMVELLPAPLGPRKPKASPRLHLDVDAVDGRRVAEALDQAAGGHERRRRSRGPTVAATTDGHEPVIRAVPAARDALIVSTRRP